MTLLEKRRILGEVQRKTEQHSVLETCRSGWFLPICLWIHFPNYFLEISGLELNIIANFMGTGKWYI